MEDITGEVGLKLVTRVLAYPGIGHKIFLRSEFTYISCVFDVPDDLQGT